MRMIKCNILSSINDDTKKHFDIYYTAFQNNELIIDSKLLIKGAKEIMEAGQDLLYPNRDILYLHFLYDYLYNSSNQ